MIKQKYSLKKQKGSAKAKKGRKNESKKVFKKRKCKELENGKLGSIHMYNN